MQEEKNGSGGLGREAARGGGSGLGSGPAAAGVM